MGTIDQEIQSKFTDDKHRFLVNMMYTSGWLRNLFSSHLAPYDLSSQQFNILRILRGANEWVAMNDVKVRMVEKAPNATRLADKLLGKELIERKRSENDRRVVYVRVTITGLALLKEIDDKLEMNPVDFTEHITMEEARVMSDILDKLRG